MQQSSCRNPSIGSSDRSPVSPRADNRSGPFTAQGVVTVGNHILLQMRFETVTFGSPPLMLKRPAFQFRNGHERDNEQLASKVRLI